MRATTDDCRTGGILYSKAPMIDKRARGSLWSPVTRVGMRSVCLARLFAGLH